MDDALAKNETNDQTGEPNGQAGLPHAEEKQSEAGESSPSAHDSQGKSAYNEKKRVPFLAMKVLLAGLTVSVFAFTSFGFGETKYTTNNWPSTIFTCGGLLPKLFSGSYALALRAAGETLHANYQSTKGNSAEAERSFQRALAAYETLGAVNTVCGHFALMGLGKAQNDQKHDAEAQKTFQRSLEVAKTVYGPEHQTVAISLRELAFGTAKEKKYAQAEKFYKEALALDTKGFGAEHSDVAYDTSCVGEVMLLQKNLPEAIKYLSQSISIYRKARGEFHPSFLWVEESLGRAYYEGAEYRQAARQFEHVLAITERLHGNPGKDYCRDVAWLSWCYYYDDNTERSRIRAKKLFDLLAKKNEAELAGMMDLVESNSEMFMMLKEYDTALAGFKTYLNLLDKSERKDPLQRRTTLLNLAKCCEALGKRDDADSYRQRAEAVE